MSQNELFHDACVIIEQAQRWAYQAVNETLIKRNWLLGMRIQHEVLNDQRAEYGEQVVKTLSDELVIQYGRGFSTRNLYYFISFYQDHPDLFMTSSAERCLEGDGKILQSLTAKCPIRLSWTHYNIPIVLFIEEAQDGEIGGEPVDAAELVFGKPSGGLVLKEPGLSACQ